MRRKTIFSLLLVFALFSLLRFSNLQHKIIFDWDQEQFSYQIKNMVEKKDPVLLGPRTTNDKGFFLGPYFTYLLTPFYIIFNYHPVALIYFVIVYNLAFFLAGFYILKKLFGEEKSLTFLFLWSFNYLLVSFDFIPWWPLLLPLGVLLTWFFLFKTDKNPSFTNYALLGLILGLSFNLHFQFIFMVFFVLTFMFFNFKKLFDLKKIGVMLGTFLLTFLPLLLFDLRHDFLNSKLFFDFLFTRNADYPHDLNAWVPVWSYFVKPFTFFDFPPAFGALIIIAFGFLFYHLSLHDNHFRKVFYRSAFVLWIVTFIAFALFGKRPSEYYFLYLAPFMLIALSKFLQELKNFKLAAGILLVLLFINLYYGPSNLERNPLGMKAKVQAVEFLYDKVDLKKNYNITLDFPLGYHTGYKYLFDLYGFQQSGNFSDPLVELTYPAEKNDLETGTAIGARIPPEVRK